MSERRWVLAAHRLARRAPDRLWRRWLLWRVDRDAARAAGAQRRTQPVSRRPGFVDPPQMRPGAIIVTQYGDTLWSIASTLGCSWHDLLNLNRGRLDRRKLNERGPERYVLFPGTKLLVPLSPQPGVPTMCLLDHRCGPGCPPRPDAYDRPRGGSVHSRPDPTRSTRR